MNIRGLIDKLKGKDKLDRTALAQVRVSLLIAALDGDITRDEVYEFRRLAQASENWSEEAEKKAFYSAIRAAGYLMLLARVAPKDELLLEFVAEADKFLPMFFALEDEERAAAVAVWKNVANADGEFSEIERDAIACLEKRLQVRSELERLAASGGYAG